MDNKQLISVRSNCVFGLNYESGKLQPQTEVVLITQEPNYVNKKDKIVREFKAAEFRFRANLEGVNMLIGELQVLATQMQQFDQMSHAFNNIIENSKPKTEK